jgi:propanol-preferring alcohol dehydrogenase
VVIGAGGLGQIVLRALSAETTITAADKLEIAKSTGSDEGLLSGDKAVTHIKDITRGQDAELVLDMVGVNPTLQMAAHVPRTRPSDDCWYPRLIAAR